MKEFEQITTSELREALSKMITKKVTIEDEKIIGETLSKEQIKTSLVFHIGLYECATIRDIFEALNKCSVYYYDSYYRDVFLEIFPDYFKLINILNILERLDFINEEVKNVTFENVYEIICNYIKNVFRNIKTYNELKDVIYIIRPLMNFNEFKEMFVNFDIFLELVMDLTPCNDEEKNKFNKLISDAKNYNEMSSLIFKLGYQMKKSKLEENESYLITQKKYLENIKIKKNIVKNKDNLNDMIKKGNELRNSLFAIDIELGTNDYFIDREKKLIVENKNAIVDSSSNLFRKIKERKKIRNSTNNVNICELNLKKLELKKDEIKKKKESFKREIELIEKKFKEISHLDFLPFDEANMQFYYADDYYLNESEFRESIEKIEGEIKNLKKQLDNIIQIGLIKFNVETIEVNNEKKVSSIKINK